MNQKPEIQYVSRFYVHGSAVPEPVEEKKKEKKPKVRQARVHKIYIDPVATCGLLVAVVMLVVLVLGAMSLEEQWQEHYAMQETLSALKRENADLAHHFRLGYSLTEVEKVAAALGLVPIEELQTISVRISIPETEPKPTLWDDIVWFFDCLFE